MGSKVVIFLLLWIPTCLTCTTSICIANVNITDCQSLPTADYMIIPQLSDLSPNLTAYCQTTALYFISGEHYLTRDLTFSKHGQTIRLSVASSFTPSTLICKNSSGIMFRISRVEISEITFSRCGKKNGSALFFDHANFTLNYVTVIYSSGAGVFASNCDSQVIKNCAFSSNLMGNIKLKLMSTSYSSVNIANTIVTNGTTGLSISVSSEAAQVEVAIGNSSFVGNIHSHLHIQTEGINTYISIWDSTFTEARNCSSGVLIESVAMQNRVTEVLMERSEVSSSSCDAVVTRQVNSIDIKNSVIKNNNGRGLFTSFASSVVSKGLRNFTNITFQNNSRGFHIVPATCSGTVDQTLNISQCNFTDHYVRLESIKHEAAEASVLHIKGDSNYTCQEGSQTLIIEKSNFERNYDTHGTCSALYLGNLNNTIVSEVNVISNNCTGMSLYGSRIHLEGHVNFVRNFAMFGAAIQMQYAYIAFDVKLTSKIYISENGVLRIVNNTARARGGGIFTDESCVMQNYKELCPFLFRSINNVKPILFSGNQANYGGDVVSGGCLSKCYICSARESECFINYTDATSLFWKLVSSSNEQSPSNFAEVPEGVVFCSTNSSNSHATCASEYQVSAYPGEIFEVALMAVDVSCVPSKGIIVARVEHDRTITAYLGGHRETSVQTRKHCSGYQLSVIGSAPGKSVVISLFLQRLSPSRLHPAQLQVNLKECPKGFTYAEDKGHCDCSAALESIRVECVSADHSLKVPPNVWIGNFNNKVAINQYCQHCSSGKRKTLYPLNTSRNSDILCKENRTGVLCGACTSNNSLQLGGYHCGMCTRSTYIGVLLVLLFCIIGIFLILTLLSLNLTVSTGMINALVFYSNIVHFNREYFLPVGAEQTTLSLEKAVRFFSVFMAWNNLDFGIETCFFDSYDIYASTWMQFLFPSYIWLLILLIVLASRYSSRVSRLTGPRTVPVLATLFLLSYTKLLSTSIAAISFTNLCFLDGKSEHTVWLLDGNISYLKGKHIPLFLFSIVCIFGFILPFTLLILLGPLLQSKSEYKHLHWVNKIKPLFDAFYGPYTKQYRYWPGILLLARIILFTTVAFYSLGDSPFIIASIAVMVNIVFVAWISLIRPHSIMPYQSRALNYLETFFFTNLAFFSIASSYFRFAKGNFVIHHQVLAVVMVGTTFFAFCGIIIFHLACSCRIAKKLKALVLACAQFRNGSSDVTVNEVDVKSINEPTQSTIELASSFAVNELREPLLAV